MHMSDELLVGRAGRFLSPPSTYIPPTLAITRIGLRYNSFFPFGYNYRFLSDPNRIPNRHVLSTSLQEEKTNNGQLKGGDKYPIFPGCFIRRRFIDPVLSLILIVCPKVCMYVPDLWPGCRVGPLVLLKGC